MFLRFVGACLLSIGKELRLGSTPHLHPEAEKTLCEFKTVFDSMPLNTSFFEGSKCLTKLIWKDMLLAVCIGCSSVIFEEYRISSLLSPHVIPVVEGCFNELLQLCNKLRLKGLPSPKSEESKRLWELLMLSEQDQIQTRNSQLLNNFTDLDANIMFYNFINGLQTYMEDLFAYLVQTCNVHNVTIPYLESMRVFGTRVVRLRHKPNMSRIFVVRSSMLQLNSVDSILPQRNIMNFPPFNRMPPPASSVQSIKAPLSTQTITTTSPMTSASPNLPSPASSFSKGSPYVRNTAYSPPIYAKRQVDPIIMMSFTDDAKDEESIISVDSGVRNYVTREQFFDAPDQVPASSQLPQSGLHGFGAGAPQSPGAPMGAPANGPTGNFANGPFPVNYSNMAPYYGYMQMSPHSGGVSTKRKPYHHLPPPISRNTSTQQLKECHNNLLEAMNLHNKQSTYSRYGRYDTTNVILRSANNSRGSGKSADSSSSNK